jgi:hypothetical protein
MSDTYVAPSFEEILNRPVADVDEPKLLPVGKYLCIVDGFPKFEKVGRNQTDSVNFTLTPMQAIDVAPGALAEALNGATLHSKKIYFRQFITEDSLYRVKNFLCDLGIPPTTLREMFSEVGGRQVVITLGHRPSLDGTRLFHDVKRTEPAV